MNGKRAKALRKAAAVLVQEFKEIAADTDYEYRHVRKQITGVDPTTFGPQKYTVDRYIRHVPSNSPRGMYRELKKTWKREARV